MERNKADPCVLKRTTDKGTTIIAIYVDDCMCLGDHEAVQELIQDIEARFKIKRMGQLSEYVGAKYKVGRDKIEISQDDLIDSLNKTQPWLSNPPVTPAAQGYVLLPTEGAFPMNSEQLQIFRSGVGKCLYLSKLSRPDISNSLRELSRYMSNAEVSFQKDLDRLIKYIIGTKEKKLTLTKPKSDQIEIVAYSDSNYASDKITRKSVTGYLIFLCGNLIAWRSRMQKCVTLSSTEAEYVALSQCAQDLIFVKQFLESLDVEVDLPMTIRVDNTGSIDLARSWTSSGNSKHIDIRHHFIRDLVEDNIIDLIFVGSDDNLADSFTKNIDQSRFIANRDLYMKSEE